MKDLLTNMRDLLHNIKHARSTEWLGSCCTLCMIQPTVPEGDDKECSGIEDPEKMSEEEKEDVAKKVGEAIEEGNKKAEEEKAAADLLKKDAAEREAKDKAKADDKKEGDDKAKEGDKDEAKKGKALHFSFSVVHQLQPWILAFSPSAYYFSSSL